MSFTLTDFTTQIEAVSGAAGLDPERPIVEQSDVDSMDMMEWLYNFQSENPGSAIDPAVFENEDGSLTLRQVYDRVLATDQG